jgi:prepilin-type N-terminal cleavage/methylation domain-containing protein
MDRFKGYTLVELIIVLTLFSIILSFAVPSLGFIRKFKEYQQIRELRKDILYARNQAIVKGKIYYVQFDYERNAYYILVDGNIVKKKYFDEGLKLIDTNTPEISFYRTGVPRSSGTIKIKNNKNKIYEVVVTPVVGKVTIKE